jgi:hypothetical protein
MKIYGYTTDPSAQEDATPKEMTEISVMADAKELRMIAAFLNKTADNMDRMDLLMTMNTYRTQIITLKALHILSL